MPSTAFLAPVAGSKWVRKIADAMLLRYANYRTVALDRLDAGNVQHDTLLSLVRRARNTRFGRDHDFARISSVADYQARVPVRDYEFFWNTYWKDAYPKLDDITWPGKIPYYALSSGTTSGATKYIPVSWEMVASNKKTAFTTLALYRSANPGAKLFAGKFFFLGGSTELRKQSDGSLAGDLSGIAMKENREFLADYVFPPKNMALIANWEEKVARFAGLSAHERITAISGIPAWMLVLFDRLKQATGKNTVPKRGPIWGSSSTADEIRPVPRLFKKEIGSDEVKFCEVYRARKGSSPARTRVTATCASSPTTTSSSNSCRSTISARSARCGTRSRMSRSASNTRSSSHRAPASGRTSSETRSRSNAGRRP